MSNYFRRSSLSLAGRPEWFRLLKILPGWGNAMIECSLSIREIANSAGEYIAGSYVWGCKEKPIKILVDGEPVFVRRNLWRFMKYVRRTGESVDIWIDALCIRQDDSVEKEQQIQLLSRIFQNARDVFSWLDEEDEEVFLAFDIIQQRAEQARCAFGKSSMSIPRLDDAQWRAVLKLFGHQYFSRRWIVQEVLLPVRLSLKCGHRQLPWTAMESFLSGFREDEKSDPRWAEVDQSVLSRLWVDRAKIHEHYGGLGLHDLLWRYRDTQCKRACDRIQAFLGLVEHGHLVYGGDNPLKLYQAVMKNLEIRRLGQGRITSFDMMTFGRFLEQDMGLRCEQLGRLIIEVGKPLRACTVF